MMYQLFIKLTNGWFLGDSSVERRGFAVRAEAFRALSRRGRVRSPALQAPPSEGGARGKGQAYQKGRPQSL